jgi:hypothetical protein
MADVRREHRALELVELLADAARGDRRYDVCEAPADDGPLFAKLILRDEQGHEYAVTVEHMPPVIHHTPRSDVQERS